MKILLLGRSAVTNKEYLFQKAFESASGYDIRFPCIMSSIFSLRDGLYKDISMMYYLPSFRNEDISSHTKTLLIETVDTKPSY